MAIRARNVRIARVAAYISCSIYYKSPLTQSRALNLIKYPSESNLYLKTHNSGSAGALTVLLDTYLYVPRVVNALISLSAAILNCEANLCLSICLHERGSAGKLSRWIELRTGVSIAVAKAE